MSMYVLRKHEGAIPITSLFGTMMLSFLWALISTELLVVSFHVLPPCPLLYSSTKTLSQIPEEVTAYFLQQAGVTVNDPKMYVD